MKFVTTHYPGAPGVSFAGALFDGLAPDGGLYVPASIEPWAGSELSSLGERDLAGTGVRTLEPFVRGELDADRLTSIVREALDFEIPLVEVEPGVFALELFHGPTLAFKDVGARVMARLMAALYIGDDAITILVATSGDTGGAVAHAYHGVPHTRVVVLYPHGRVSPTQEAQLTMFNGQETNVRAYTVAGSFDDCQRLVKTAFADPILAARLSSANSINVGRLLPQMIYYAHAVGHLQRRGLGSRPVVLSTPSGNFGNLTAGLMMKRAGLPVGRYAAATNLNDVVPVYLSTGRFEPGASIHTVANAMDVGNPSNFDRLMWLYGGELEAIRRDVFGSRHEDDEVRATIRRVYGERQYLLDPHSAIAYLGVKELLEQERRAGRKDTIGIFLATAHPAKFAEIVEPVIGQTVEKPKPLVDALAAGRQVVRIAATLDAVTEHL